MQRTTIPGTRNRFELWNTPERLVISDARDLLSFFWERTDRPLFANLEAASARTGISGEFMTEDGSGSLAVSAKNVVRLEYVDRLEHDSESRFRLAFSKPGVTIEQDALTTAFIQGKSKAAGIKILMPAAVDEVVEDIYGITYRLSTNRNTAWVAFLATGRTIEDVRKALARV